MLLAVSCSEAMRLLERLRASVWLFEQFSLLFSAASECSIASGIDSVCTLRLCFDLGMIYLIFMLKMF